MKSVNRNVSIIFESQIQDRLFEYTWNLLGRVTFPFVRERINDQVLDSVFSSISDYSINGVLINK